MSRSWRWTRPISAGCTTKTRWRRTSSPKASGASTPMRASSSASSSRSPRRRKPPLKSVLSTDLIPAPQAEPCGEEDVEHERYRDHQHERPQRLFVLFRERQDGAGVQARDHHPDDGEQQPEPFPERHADKKITDLSPILRDEAADARQLFVRALGVCL